MRSLGRWVVRRVLLRPLRIGTLLLLGAIVAMAAVGAQGWWVLLGLTLFLAAAAALVALWLDSDTEQPSDGADPPAPRHPEPAAPDADPPDEPGVDVPDQRVPDPE